MDGVVVEGGVDVGEVTVGVEGVALRGEFGELRLEGLVGELADLEGLCRLEE